MVRLIVIGAGGHGRVVLDVLSARGDAAALFLDDAQARWNTTFDGVLIAGGVAGLRRLTPPEITAVFVAIGDNHKRQGIDAWVRECGMETPALVHPHASVSARAEVGAGSLVCAGAVIGPGARLGRGVIVNTGARVDHDCDIGDFSHLAPGSVLCGGVSVGTLSLVGAGATVAPGLLIGAAAVVGIGAAVVAPVPADVTVAGVPARPLAGVDPSRRRSDL